MEKHYKVGLTLFLESRAQYMSLQIYFLPFIEDLTFVKILNIYEKSQ